MAINEEKNAEANEAEQYRIPNTIQLLPSEVKINPKTGETTILTPEATELVEKAFKKQGYIYVSLDVNVDCIPINGYCK